MNRPFDALLTAAQDGDRDALGELWRHRNPALLRYLRGRGALDAEDVAAQVWVEVASGLTRFTGGPEDFDRWMFTIARRRWQDSLRRRARRPHALHAEVPVRPRPSDEGAVDDLDWALALVRTLPPQQAEVVLLRVVVDLSVDDIAALTGIRAGTVRVLVHRGLRRLREKVRLDVTAAAPAAMERTG